MNAVEVIAVRHVEREYGFDGIEAIVQHPDYGRLLIKDGFGGMDSIEGGAVRWRHGMAVSLPFGETFDSLKSVDMSRVWAGYDDARPVQELSGREIDRIAKMAGLGV